MNVAIMGAVISKAGPPPTISVAPGTVSTESTTNFASTANFTATLTGGAPSSIVWSVEGQVNGFGTVVGGQGTATATIQLVVADSGGASAVGHCTVRCTVVIGGVTYSATARFIHQFDYSSGGGRGGQ